MSFSRSPSLRPELNRPFPRTRHVLYEYDGPKLVLAVDEHECQVIGVAVNEIFEERLTRWVFAPAAPADVVALLEGGTGLRELFTRGTVRIFDLGPKETSLWELDGASLADELLPDGDATLPELTPASRDQLLSEQCRLANEQPRLARTETVGDFEPRVVSALKELISVIHKAGATFRLVANDRTYRFDAERVRMAAERTATELTEEPDVVYPGTLLGYLPSGRQFEFREDHRGEVIRGRIAREADLDEIRKWLDKRSVAHIRVVTVKRGAGQSHAFTLLGLEPPSDRT